MARCRAARLARGITDAMPEAALHEQGFFVVEKLVEVRRPADAVSGSVTQQRGQCVAPWVQKRAPGALPGAPDDASTPCLPALAAADRV